MKRLILTIILVLVLAIFGFTMRMETSRADDPTPMQPQDVQQKVGALEKRISELEKVLTPPTILQQMADNLQKIATNTQTLEKRISELEKVLTPPTILQQMADNLRKIATNTQTIWSATFWMLVLVVLAVIGWLLVEQYYRKRFQEATNEVARLVQTVTGPQEFPTITTVQPDRGPTGGGTLITIRGRNYRYGLTVTLRGIPATHVQVISTEEIHAVTPPGTAGPADVTVANRYGEQDIRQEGFTYQPPPVVRGVNPNSAAAATNVVIWGGHFQQGARVIFDNLPDVGSIFQTENHITVPVPTGPAAGQIVKVLVRNQDGQEGELLGAFTYQ